MNILAKIKKVIYPLLILGGILSTQSQTFTYSGSIYGSNAAGISGAVKKALVEAVGEM
jgi:hypothetical protein